MSGQRVETVASFDVPQTHCGVEGGRGQDQVGVGVVGAGAGGRPFDGVDLFVVRLEVVDAGVAVHAPDLRI